MALLAHGTTERDLLSAPPESGIIDKADFLEKNSEIAQRISAKIHQLANDHGFKIYLYIEPVLIATSAQEKANDLRHNWLPDGDGLVVVYESDSRNLGIGQDMIGDPTMKQNPHRVPTYETTSILNQSLTSMDVNLASEMYLDGVMGKIFDGFDDYFIRRQAPTPPERSIRSILLAVGAFTVLALGMIGTGALIRYSSMTKGKTFRFPIVDRPERLGAPCGAGVTSRRFIPIRNPTSDLKSQS